MLSKLLVEGDAIDLPWFDPNTLNLVAEVSIKVIFITTTAIILTIVSRRSAFIIVGVGQKSVPSTVASK